jgi:hypothetical protein
VERVTGIEPVYSAWKAAVLPLYYTRNAIRPAEPCHDRRQLVNHRAAPALRQHAFTEAGRSRGLLPGRCRRRQAGDGGRDWIRTSVHLRGQIYSLLPLTTRPPFHRAASSKRGRPMPKQGRAVNAPSSWLRAFFSTHSNGAPSRQEDVTRMRHLLWRPRRPSTR